MKLSDRITAGILFVLLACSPGGIWVIFIFVGNSGSLTWLETLEFAFSSENTNRGFFVLLAISLLSSAGAGVLLLLKKLSRAKLKAVFVGGVAQCFAYLFWSAWVLAVISAIPLFWLGREYKKA